MSRRAKNALDSASMQPVRKMPRGVDERSATQCHVAPDGSGSTCYETRVSVLFNIIKWAHAPIKLFLGVKTSERKKLSFHAHQRGVRAPGWRRGWLLRSLLPWPRPRLCRPPATMATERMGGWRGTASTPSRVAPSTLASYSTESSTGRACWSTQVSTQFLLP